jgi:Flp pilus assembly CpaE family ATPase
VVDATAIPEATRVGSRPAHRLSDAMRRVDELRDEADVLLNGATDHRRPEADLGARLGVRSIAGHAP